jgi:hypothetical protein
VVLNLANQRKLKDEKTCFVKGRSNYDENTKAVSEQKQQAAG